MNIYIYMYAIYTDHIYGNTREKVGNLTEHVPFWRFSNQHMLAARNSGSFGLCMWC
jgi:hypothetical protein